MPESYKLCTILFADIAGYTALMQQNESHALQLLSHFKTKLEKLVPQHQGQIVQFFGDGCLLSFDSAINAVQCGIELQKNFREIEIPVRMGMHLGEVLLSNNNLFGDSVNLASRVESISIPGAILVSKTVRDQIRNKAAFQLTSLGTFSFKNVKESMEVFAIQNEGLIVPDRKKIQGKTASPPKKINRLPLFVGTVVFLMLGVFWWSYYKTNNEVLSPETRANRVTVTVFENQTALPELDAFGKMISDWITNGLMESGSANVINAANIEHKLDQFGTNSKVNTDFAASTGLDMILSGRYYRLEDQLYVQANLINASNGEVMHATRPVAGQKEDLAKLLQTLTQQILGYWAVKDFSRFAGDPPKYEAYQLWLKADAIDMSDPARSIEYLQAAYAADTSFYDPLIRLHSVYRKEGLDSLSNPVFEFLLQHVEQFTPWETLRFQELKAIRERDWSTVAKIAERMYQMDASDQEALHNAIIAYNYINYPSKSLELINSFDTIYLNQQLRELSWLETDQIFPNFQLGNYQAIDSIAVYYQHPSIPDALAAMHLKSLIHLGNTTQLAKYYDYYRENGVYNFSGRPTPFFIINTMVCDELYITDQKELLQTYVKDLKIMAGEPGQNPDYYTIMGYVYFYLGELEQAAKAWEMEEVNDENWPGWLRRSRQYDRLSRIGHCYALTGMSDETQSYLDKLQEILMDHPNTAGIREYYSARILAGSGQKEAAIDALEKAIQKGFFFYGPVRFHIDPFLKPLFENQRFKELVRPK